MYQNDWMLSRLAAERQRDFRQQAERDRLIRETRRANHPQRHTVYHALDWMGQQMIRGGERLQARHAMYHRRTLTRTVGG